MGLWPAANDGLKIRSVTQDQSATQDQSIPHTGGKIWFYKLFSRCFLHYSFYLSDTATLNFFAFCANFESLRDGAVAGGE
jgi:hypothetical protein